MVYVGNSVQGTGKTVLFASLIKYSQNVQNWDGVWFSKFSFRAPTALHTIFIHSVTKVLTPNLRSGIKKVPLEPKKTIPPIGQKIDYGNL